MILSHLSPKDPCDIDQNEGYKGCPSGLDVQSAAVKGALVGLTSCHHSGWEREKIREWISLDDN